MSEPVYILARLRPGAVLEDGRVAGERDRVVHVVAIDPDTFTLSTPVLYAACGCPLHRGQAEQVRSVAGQPCNNCMVTAPAGRTLAHASRGVGVSRTETDLNA